MKFIQYYILEKLKINKDSKIAKKDLLTEPLYLINNMVTFPLTLEIDHQYKENIIGYKKIKSNTGNSYIKFYNDKNEDICSMTWKEITKIFDDEKGIMLNTKYGWLGTIWRK